MDSIYKINYKSRRTSVLFTLLSILILFPLLSQGKLLTIHNSPSTDTVHEGFGKFVYSDYKPLANKPITVYYYMPEDLPKDAPIMILLHGTLRNAITYRKNMARFAKRHKFLLIAPKISKEHYRYTRDYHQGGVFTKKGIKKDKKDWTFSVIEPLFDYVKKEFHKDNEGYILYGFSAGSQFIHRFTWFVPENRAVKTVSSSAGSYTMPDYNINYPFGLGKTGVTKDDLKKAFSKDFTVVIGDADTVLSQKYLPKSNGAKKQGRDRLVRAKEFYHEAEQKAKELSTPFNWKLMVVPGVGHNNGKMAKPVTDMLFKK